MTTTGVPPVTTEDQGQWSTGTEDQWQSPTTGSVGPADSETTTVVVPPDTEGPENLTVCWTKLVSDAYSYLETINRKDHILCNCADSQMAADSGSCQGGRGKQIKSKSAKYSSAA